MNRIKKVRVYRLKNIKKKPRLILVLTCDRQQIRLFMDNYLLPFSKHKIKTQTLRQFELNVIPINTNL